MKILGIETSCDETAISVLLGTGDLEYPKFSVLSQAISSQIAIHQEFGGVVPNLARREHQKAIIPLLKKTLESAGLLKTEKNTIDSDKKEKIKKLLHREETLIDEIIQLGENYETPDIDMITVTEGPGLEPALWVGINTALSLSIIWEKPCLPINHMAGHLFSPLLNSEKISWPVLGLLVSGGHTELVLAKNFSDIKKIGQTRDDAVGEAFDKVARLLNLPYPGGPEISRLAETKKDENNEKWTFPRPMINSPDLDFSFSGLKTAVLYSIKDKELSKDDVSAIAYEFQEAVTDVLVAKTKKAIEQFSPKTLIVAGGVAGNKRLQEKVKKICIEENLKLLLPEKDLTTDNASMIAIAGYIKFLTEKNTDQAPIKASGNLSL